MHSKTALDPHTKLVSDQNFIDLFQRVLTGKAEGKEIVDIVAGYSHQGIIKISINTKLLDLVKLPNNLHLEGAMDPSQFQRYGPEGKPVYSFLICEQSGLPGATYVYMNGDTAQPTEYEGFNGPLHLHMADSHLSIVMQGQGNFFFLTRTPMGARVVRVPVSRGDLVFIPPRHVHTFWGREGKPFAVLSMTAEYIPSQSPDFQVFLDKEALTRLPPQISYDEYLAFKN